MLGNRFRFVIVAVIMMAIVFVGVGATLAQGTLGDDVIGDPGGAGFGANTPSNDAGDDTFIDASGWYLWRR